MFHDINILRDEVELLRSELEEVKEESRAYKLQYNSVLSTLKTMDSQLGINSRRYIVGTSLYDIARHPFHAIGAVKIILNVIRDKLSERLISRSNDSYDGQEEYKYKNKALLVEEQRRKAREEGRKIWILKCPAPEQDKTAWGDYHFCVSLALCLEEQGQYAEVQMYESWDEVVDADVILVLRGLHKYRRIKESKAIHIMWNISHPEDISANEYNSYDIVFVASYHYAEILAHRVRVPVFPLLQCTDTKRFYITENEKRLDREGLLFIGNGRLEGRLCVNWALASQEPLRVIGKNWNRYLPSIGNRLVAETIDNKAIRNEYIRARATLNDHWLSMKTNQFINNRVFDSLACGLPVISDSFDELVKLFPDEILYYYDEYSFNECIHRLSIDYDTIKSNVDRARPRIIEEYSFDARASSLISAVASYNRRNTNRSDLLYKDINDDEKWDIVLLKQNYNGVVNHRYEALITHLAEDPIVNRVIVFDVPVYRDLLDKYGIIADEDMCSKKQHNGDYVIDKEFGYVVSDKVVQYNYIIPRSQEYSKDKYREYIQYVENKEKIGNRKIVLWVYPEAVGFEAFLDEFDADIIVTDFIDNANVVCSGNQDKKDIIIDFKKLLSISDFAICNSQKVYENLLELCPWKRTVIHIVTNKVEISNSISEQGEAPGILKSISATYKWLYE